MGALCEAAEEGSDMAFKCSCHAVMRVKKSERSEEQAALAKECMAKRKEKKEDKKNDDNEDSGSDSGDKKKKGSWKAKVKACRRAKKAIKDGHASEEQTAFAEENCQKMKGGKRKDRKPKDESSDDSDDSDDASADESESHKGKGGKRKKRGRKARGPK